MSEVALKNVNGSLKDMVREFERQLIEAALAASAGNQRRAAATLGLLPTTLHEKMKRLGLLRRGVTPGDGAGRGRRRDAHVGLPGPPIRPALRLRSGSARRASSRRRHPSSTMEGKLGADAFTTLVSAARN